MNTHPRGNFVPAGRRFHEEQVRRIDALLPQTQCTKCGYDGCLPYAQALADGATQPNRCPPGGEAGAHRLADLIGVARLPLDRSRGEPEWFPVAVIDETHCIGCTLCIRACPVDAIVGANKRMHTVLEDACTGCELCIPPCPVDCITMASPNPARAWTSTDADTARRRYQARQQRTAASEQQASERPAPAPAGTGGATDEAKRAAIAAALARARARRNA